MINPCTEETDDAVMSRCSPLLGILLILEPVWGTDARFGRRSPLQTNELRIGMRDPRKKLFKLIHQQVSSFSSLCPGLPSVGRGKTSLAFIDSWAGVKACQLVITHWQRRGHN